MSSSQSIIGFLGIFPDLLILIICISYLAKARSSDAMLLFIGSLIRVLVRLFYFVMPYFVSNVDSPADRVREYYSLGNVAALIGSILFCVGFVLLIKRVTSTFTQPRA